MTKQEKDKIEELIIRLELELKSNFTLSIQQ